MDQYCLMPDRSVGRASGVVLGSPAPAEWPASRSTEKLCTELGSLSTCDSIWSQLDAALLPVGLGTGGKGGRGRLRSFSLEPLLSVGAALARVAGCADEIGCCETERLDLAQLVRDFQLSDRRVLRPPGRTSAKAGRQATSAAQARVMVASTMLMIISGAMPSVSLKQSIVSAGQPCSSADRNSQETSSDGKNSIA